jgi:hypothetical protein
MTFDPYVSSLSKATTSSGFSIVAILLKPGARRSNRFSNRSTEPGVKGVESAKALTLEPLQNSKVRVRSNKEIAMSCCKEVPLTNLHLQLERPIEHIENQRLGDSRKAPAPRSQRSFGPYSQQPPELPEILELHP